MANLAEFCRKKNAYTVSRYLPSVRVHAGEEVDPGGVDEVLDLGVPGQVARAQVVGQVQQQLTTQHLQPDIQKQTTFVPPWRNFAPPP